MKPGDAGRLRRRAQGPRRLRQGAAILVGLVLLAGCGSVQYGSPPRTGNLSRLTLGVSKPADILVALGEPRGRGAARLVADPTPRTIWFYEFTEASGGRVDLSILLVFIRDDRYDGHLWFSSSSLLATQQ